jgi:ABC-type sugar transport system ATPase subunit
MTAPPFIDARGITKRYGPITALDDVSFELRPGEVHALLGHNGAGKSTLVKILSGLVRPDSGTLTMAGEEVTLRTPQQAQQHGVALVDQELSLVPALTVEENILLGNVESPFLQRPGGSRAATREILDGLGLRHVAPSTHVRDLAIGERQLIEIARALSRDARVLILDEPTATLSDTEIEHVFRAVRQVVAQGRSVIYVSHRLGEVLELCDRASIFRDGRHVETRAVSELDRRGLIELMLGDVPEPSQRDGLHEDAGEVATVTIRNLSVPPRVQGFDLTARGGQIIALAGQIGSGASEVLRALAGLVPDAQGDVSINGKDVRLGSPRRCVDAGTVYASGDRKGEGLFLGHSVQLNLVATRLPALTRWGLVRRGAAASVARQLIDVIGMDRKRMRTPVVSLSGGNQQKVFLGRCLEQHAAELLLLEEPTRGVDVGGRMEIHDLVRVAAAHGNAVIFASTELDEVLDLADTIVTMHAGRVVRTLPRRLATSAEILGDMTHGNSESRAGVAA